MHPTAAVVSGVLLVLLCTVSTCQSSRKMGNKRRENPNPGQAPNMCARDIDMKLMCHCTSDETRTSTVDADCLVLHEDFPQSDVAWKSFEQHPLLRHVTLTVHRKGFMGYLPSTVFGRQRELRSITITFAEVREIPPYAFVNLTRLENITLTNNHIQVLDMHAFVHHPALRVLNLEDNEITLVDRLAFGQLPQLQELVLAKNNLTALPEELFVELDGLLTLRLNENQLGELRREMFTGLGSLQTLDVSYNQVRRVGDGAFVELWSLQVLDLGSNGMEHLSERAFDGLSNLHSLVLRNNRLTSLGSGVFGGVSALNLLDLSGNQLETLTFNTVLPLMDNLINSTMHVLQILDNKFQCDCRLTWMFDVRNRTKNTQLRSALEKVTCHMQTDPESEHHGGGDINDVSATNTVHRFVAASPASPKQPHQHKQHNFGSQHQHQQHQQQHQYYDDVMSAAGVDNELGHHANVHAGNQQQQPPPAHGQHRPRHLTKLMSVGVEHLPCAEELADPTELPLSRESIGLDLRWLSGSSAAAPVVTLRRGWWPVLTAAGAAMWLTVAARA